MTLYIGNVPFDCTEGQIYDLLSPFGNIFDLNYPKDRVTGAQRGFAFVTLPDKATALAAIQSLNGTELRGRSIKVTEAKGPERPKTTEIPHGFRRQGENPFGGFGQRRR